MYLFLSPSLFSRVGPREEMRERERDIESCCVRRKGKRQRKQEFCSLPYSQSDERETFHFFSRYLVLGGQIL